MKSYEEMDVYPFIGFAKKLMDQGKASRIDCYDNKYNIYDISTKRDCDVKFYTDIASKSGNNVLDVGCGSGRLTLKLLEKGLEVTGVDSSSSLIKVAKEKVEKSKFKAEFKVCDIRKMRLSKKYNSAIMSFCVLSYLQSIEECKEVFKEIYNSLEENGVLAFDFDVCNAGERDFGPYIINQICRDDEVIIRVLQTSSIDESTRICNVVDYIIGNKKSEILVEANTEKKYKVDDIKLILEQVGFKVEGIYSDFNGTVYNMNLPEEECIIVAKKEKTSD